MSILEQTPRCHDCEKVIRVDGKKLTGGKLLKYQDGDTFVHVVKCNECFKKNPGLQNFRECEVYSRVVGYLRPIKQWNIGKKQEFKDRKNYKNGATKKD